MANEFRRTQALGSTFGTLVLFAGPSPAIRSGVRHFPNDERVGGEAQRLCTGVLAFVLVLAAGAALPGCGGGGVSSATLPPPPPPPSISITVAPAATSVLLGNTQAFSAEVANTTDTTVSWGVNG